MAKFLVDANVLSEATKAAPDPLVVDWLRRDERLLLAVDPVFAVGYRSRNSERPSEAQGAVSPSDSFNSRWYASMCPTSTSCTRAGMPDTPDSSSA